MLPMMYGKNLSDFSETWMTSDKRIHVTGVSKRKLKFGPVPHVGRIYVLIIIYFRRKSKTKA